MTSLEPARLKRFVDADPDGPVVMLNLLRFVPGGAETYKQYIEQFNSTGVSERYGVTIVYAGVGDTPLATAGGPDWDMVALVSYPSRKHFLEMINDPDYQRFEHLRAEAVAATVLQPTRPAL